MSDFAGMERYRGRCEAVLIRLNRLVAAAALDQAQHLIDHGEPAEGLRSLAWAIKESDLRVPASEIREIKMLTAELISPEYMPPDFEAHALPE